VNNSEDDAATLVELKRSYKEDCDELEAEIRMRLNLEQSERKQELTTAYVERLAKAIADRLKPLLLEVLKD
jgi:hypothetical protein